MSRYRSCSRSVKAAERYRSVCGMPAYALASRVEASGVGCERTTFTGTETYRSKGTAKPCLSKPREEAGAEAQGVVVRHTTRRPSVHAHIGEATTGVGGTRDALATSETPSWSQGDQHSSWHSQAAQEQEEVQGMAPHILAASVDGPRIDRGRPRGLKLGITSGGGKATTDAKADGAGSAVMD
ncbi:unnamed protein product [Phytophthora lilii]|uniref:Unnamed protein product n=1 Tax=Phytophthora lilii TaxID=2077276 RepID=A0A9W6WGG1_9STRA|nr:unnamed protein product [Phytophthora lilii]